MEAITLKACTTLQNNYMFANSAQEKDDYVNVFSKRYDVPRHDAQRIATGEFTLHELGDLFDRQLASYLEYKI